MVNYKFNFCSRYVSKKYGPVSGVFLGKQQAVIVTDYNVVKGASRIIFLIPIPCTYVSPLTTDFWDYLEKLDHAILMATSSISFATTFSWEIKNHFKSNPVEQTPQAEALAKSCLLGSSIGIGI